jgi:hypothetical protein
MRDARNDERWICETHLDAAKSLGMLAHIGPSSTTTARLDPRTSSWILEIAGMRWRSVGRDSRRAIDRNSLSVVGCLKGTSTCGRRLRLS